MEPWGLAKNIIIHVASNQKKGIDMGQNPKQRSGGTFNMTNVQPRRGISKVSI